MFAAIVSILSPNGTSCSRPYLSASLSVRLPVCPSVRLPVIVSRPYVASHLAAIKLHRFCLCLSVKCIGNRNVNANGNGIGIGNGNVSPLWPLTVLTNIGPECCCCDITSNAVNTVLLAACSVLQPTIGWLACHPASYHFRRAVIKSVDFMNAFTCRNGNCLLPARR